MRSVDVIGERTGRWPRASGPASDWQLVRGVAGGDEEALADLYQRHSRPLYNYLLRLVRQPQVAEDLLQEVFVGVWQGAGRFRGRARVTTWLFRIAHNQAVSWLRRQRPASELDEAGGLPAGDDPAESAMQTWRADQVQAALDQLSPKHRAVLELAFLHGFSCAEIAEIVGCPPGTVKSRMCYARRRLGELLRGLGLGDEPD